MSEVVNVEISTCYHCGETCQKDEIIINEKIFCCEGCKLVYEILEEHGLCTYYDLDNNPGINLRSRDFGERYAYLTNDEIVRMLLDYASDSLCKITLQIPSIHCSSCIWLLENLYKLCDGISFSRVNFIKKELALNYYPRRISLKEIAELLATLGYAPDISLESSRSKEQHKTRRSILLKLGVVGFCAGNIMLLSFPEYFGLNDAFERQFREYFIWLNLILSLPVFFYGGTGYLVSAFRSIRKKMINLDVPISIGIIALFSRSLFETLSGMGPGYWDSLAGLIFFLLTGKWLQNKTFENLSFERNYRSYFPLAATIIKKGMHKSVPVTDLKVDDKILIRNQELIPADCRLLSDEAWLDYSFVTGESEPVRKQMGDYIYAGGRQTGPGIELSVQKSVSRSYLTQLWNNEAFTKEKETAVTRLADDFSRYFTYITLSIATGAGVFWLFVNPSVMWDAFTAVLIVACPCALSLSMPFAMETTMRIFGRNGYYVKNTGIIQHMATISHIVFDKTGTLTQGRKSGLTYAGVPLNARDQQMIRSLAANSAHPLSSRLYQHFSAFTPTPVFEFEETAGAGLAGTVEGIRVKLGTADFIGREGPDLASGGVHVSIDGHYKGYFLFMDSYRSGIETTIKKLKERFRLSLLSGDKKGDQKFLIPLFGKNEQLHFGQSPTDKLEHIKKLQDSGEKVLMIGDGLNDAGALRQSDVGMVLSDDIQAFFPACDVLADAKGVNRLEEILRFSRTGVNVVKVSFLLSMVYNLIGLSWAVSGNLSPVFAAILMPVSSVSVVGFAVGATCLLARMRRL